mmetsp:Transcript_30174/g.83254  ORF Transcript_30174/g.83254 Transcript_30174/m.83254 type:complete len:256 (+) Transcript_30174:359-1126(+)
MSHACWIVPKRRIRYFWKSMIAMTWPSVTVRMSRGFGNCSEAGATSNMMPFTLMESRIHFPSFQIRSPFPPLAKVVTGLTVIRWKPPQVPLTTKWISLFGRQLSGSSATSARPWTSKLRSESAPCRHTRRVPATSQMCRQTSSMREIPLPTLKRIALKSMELPMITSSRPPGPTSVTIQPEGNAVSVTKCWLWPPVSTACRATAAKRIGCLGRRPAGSRPTTRGSAGSPLALGSGIPTRSTTPRTTTMGELPSKR